MKSTRIFMWLCVVASCLVVSPPASAHPGTGILVDSKGQFYFVHGIRNRILKLDVAGKMTTLCEGTTGGKLSNPHHLVFDHNQNICSVGDSDGKICRVLPGGRLEQIYPLTSGPSISDIGSGGDPWTLDSAGTIYCVEYRQFEQCRIRTISLDGKINNLAGGAWGYADGKGSQAQFRDLHSAGFVCRQPGTLLVTDNGTSVRKISADGTVTTLAGGKEEGYADGPGKQARFHGAMGLAIDGQGNIFVADSHNRRIRRITPDGVVSTVAGSGKRGSADGPALDASFEDPTGVAAGPDGSVYILDYLRDNPRVRKLSKDGKVTTEVVVGSE